MIRGLSALIVLGLVFTGCGRSRDVRVAPSSNPCATLMYTPPPAYAADGTPSASSGRPVRRPLDLAGAVALFRPDLRAAESALLKESDFVAGYYRAWSDAAGSSVLQAYVFRFAPGQGATPVECQAPRV